MTTSNTSFFAPIRHLILAVLVVAALFPIYFILTNTGKSPTQFATNPWFPTVDYQWGNFSRGWSEIGRPILNSVVIVLTSLVGILLFASMSAYAFSILRFPGRRALFSLVFILLLIPGFLTLIPLYLQIQKLDWLPHPYMKLILPYIAGGQAFSIFVLKTFFDGISYELVEAAKIDGAGDFRIFASLVVPLSLPVIASVAIVNIVPLWNDLLLPQLLLDRANRTVTMALVAFQGNAQSHTATDFGALMGSYAIASIPLVILFAFLMRYYVEGLTAGSLKM